MKARPLLKVSVLIPASAEDAVMELLGRVLGGAASIHHDVESGEINACVYLQKISDWTPARRRSLQAGLDDLRQFGVEVGAASIATEKIPREDWAESWKRHFKPMLIGRALLVKPGWSKRRPARGQAVVVLDPGLSFGTGQHPTTRFCLEQLVQARAPATGVARCLLDIGTGSGILAIAAVKLGYRPVEAFDFDPDAVRIARDNARRNQVSRQIRFAHADLTKLPGRAPRRFDVVCANLIYDLLLEARARILNRVAPGGTLVLAGILATQFPLVQRAYEEKGWRLIASREEKEWKSGAFRRE